MSINARQAPVDTIPLELANVSHEFHGSAGIVPVLSDLSVEFTRRSWTAIMGPSGSGKSTLLLCAAGLIRSTSGTIRLAGFDVRDAAEKQLTRMRRDRVGFVFQSFNLVPSLTAAQNVELPLRLAGKHPKRSIAFAALERVGLSGRTVGQRPAELSGGQQQRVAIARALVTRPAVMFADEPTGALDSNTSMQVLDTFSMMVESGSTIVMVTHDPAVAARADRTLFLFDGRIVDETASTSAEQIATRIATLEASRVIR